MEAYIENSVAFYREKKKLTQEELSEKVSVSRQTIIAIEKGKYSPSVMLALKLAMVFDVSVEKLFTISYEK